MGIKKLLMGEVCLILPSYTVNICVQMQPLYIIHATV